MPIPFHIFAPKTSLRPRLACEITPEGVVTAQQGSKRGTDAAAVMAFAPLAPGIVNPGLCSGDNLVANFADRALVVAALRKALDEVAGRDKQLTLVVPDAAVRVLLMDFDTLPAKVQEALPIVRFRLKKLAPFDVEDAAVSYQVMRQRQDVGQTHMKVLATVMPAAVRTEYESAVRSAGYEPGVILPSTLASLAALPSDSASLVINRNGQSLTTAITQKDELLLHRTLELPSSEEPCQEELVRAVSVAVAYFEDTLQREPRVLNYVGPGGAQEFTQSLGPALGEVLNDYGLQIRDLVQGPAMGAVTAMPQGLAAGVMGALAS
jgi:type IV pilus assembly protein PilM